ncbi:hypothetical protein SADUNF_Sadunf08G0102700 [Salix dunnii]|uniref:Acyl-ACP thioesterase-like C-terminal domain-containing protein n=1 Tax=Salix dunnii TaxID=1413687 RepID=A0A835MXT6_9ROSI|nr:hypothetical protein SADUNF_Sadunf08G0102700 [Salix dunnii]
MADILGQTSGVAKTLVASVQNGHISKEQIRQNIPTTKQFVDYHRQGLVIEEGVGYRQTVAIRSYEVGADKTATLESILDLLQVRDHGNRHMGWSIREEWNAARLAHSKPSNRSRLCTCNKVDFITEIIISLETSYPRRCPEKISKLDSKAKYVNSNLKPKRSDLDMNQHVNNVKYLRWMLEAIRDHILESHQLSSIILEYRRECGGSNIVQSLCEPDEDGILNSGLKQNNDRSPLNRFSLASEIMEGKGLLGSLDNVPLRYTHLLQTQGETKNEEIVRGKTIWKKRQSNTEASKMPFSI